MIMLVVIFACATLPALLFFWNLALYLPPRRTGGEFRPSISLLIPARNEEASIAAVVDHALRSEGVELEIIVLNDASTDSTAEIVAAVASRDPRLRVKAAPPLPPGWNGKQHACHVLASLAVNDTFCFLDADVRLAPEALARMAQFLGDTKSDLVSGFPQEQTGSLMERLLIPLIHFILLGFLPLAAMRRSRRAAFAAGCGQFLMTTRRAYFESGGHSAIRSTMHDGLLLPGLYRRRGLRTDLADLTALACCRMYRSAPEVWHGLSKNATEGIAAPARIVPFTLLLFLGQVAPLLAAAAVLCGRWPMPLAARAVAYGAVVASYLPRLIAVVRFRQSLVGALLHPLGVALLLVLEWYALGRKLTGHSFTWKQRACDAG